MSALRHVRPDATRAPDGSGEEQRDSGRAGAIDGAWSDGLPVHARLASAVKSTFERVIASGNRRLTQVKNNQPGLRRKLALGCGGSGERRADCARSEISTGRSRFETRAAEVFDAKAWFSRTPWEKLIKTVLRLERTSPSAQSTAIRTLDAQLRDSRLESLHSASGFFAQSGGTRGSAGTGASRTAAITCATQPSPRTRRDIRKNPHRTLPRRLRSFALQSASRRPARKHQKRQMARRDSTSIRIPRNNGV